MILYLVRHGIAAQSGAGMADEDRELTPEGIEKMKKAAAGLRAVDATPEIVLCSPLIRARQTAEIVMQAIEKGPSLKLAPMLAPGGSRSALYQELRKHAKADGVMLVGHQPTLGEIAAEITSGSSSHPLDLKKGGACAIEIERLEPVLRGTLLWLMPSTILRKLHFRTPG